MRGNNGTGGHVFMRLFTSDSPQKPQDSKSNPGPSSEGHHQHHHQHHHEKEEEDLGPHWSTQHAAGDGREHVSGDRYGDKGPTDKEYFQPEARGRIFGSLAVALGGLLVAFKYIDSVKEEKRQQRKKPKASGKAYIGGPWELIDDEGKTRTHEDFLGEYQLIYFGFTYCPDICPAELDKMTTVLKNIDTAKLPRKVVPLFISVDPERDGPAEVKEYLSEFDKRIIGLCGNERQVKHISKTFRVYYSKGPPNPDDPMDYQVDHTVVMYLMDKKGEFMKHFASSVNAEDMSQEIINLVKEAEGM